VRTTPVRGVGLWLAIVEGPLVAIRYLGKRTHRFYFENDDQERASYVLIFGDEVETLSGVAPSGGDFRRVRYRGRIGEWEPPPLLTERPAELYFLDVGQGDAAYVVTPNGTTMLVDGGLRPWRSAS
jgi:hypothetical protein